MIIILVLSLVTLGKSNQQNETNWGRLQRTLCPQFHLVAKDKFESRFSDSEVIDLNPILFDLSKMMVGLVFSILGIYLLCRLFGLIKNLSTHSSSSMNIPQYLLGSHKNKTALMLLLFLCCLCLFTQFFMLFANTQSFQKQVQKTVCLFLDFPQEFSRAGNKNGIQYLYNHSDYHSELRKNQILLQKIKTSANQVQKLINSDIQNISDKYTVLKEQCSLLVETSSNLNKFVSQAREIIYFLKSSLSSLLFENDAKWFILQLPRIIAALVTRMVVYCFILIMVSIPGLFKHKFLKTKCNWFLRLGLLSIFFVPFIILINNAFNSIFVPVSGSICRILDQNGYSNILHNFAIDPAIKGTLQQFIGKIQHKSDGNLVTAFDRRTIRVYQEFLANTTEPTELKHIDGQDGTQSTEVSSIDTQIKAEHQKLREWISKIVQNTNSPYSALNRYSMRVIGEYIESLQHQMCKSNLQIWSRIAWRQFWIAVNIIATIGCFGLTLLRIRKQQNPNPKIQSTLEFEQAPITAER